MIWSFAAIGVAFFFLMPALHGMHEKFDQESKVVITAKEIDKFLCDIEMQRSEKNSVLPLQLKTQICAFLTKYRVFDGNENWRYVVPLEALKVFSQDLVFNHINTFSLALTPLYTSIPTLDRLLKEIYNGLRGAIVPDIESYVTRGAQSTDILSSLKAEIRSIKQSNQVEQMLALKHFKALLTIAQWHLASCDQKRKSLQETHIRLIIAILVAGAGLWVILRSKSVLHVALALVIFLVASATHIEASYSMYASNLALEKRQNKIRIEIDSLLTESLEIEAQWLKNNHKNC